MVAIFGTLDQPLDPILTREVAMCPADVRPAADSQFRMDYLREPANEGVLSDDERSQHERFIESLDLLATLKSHARIALDRQNP